MKFRKAQPPPRSPSDPGVRGSTRFCAARPARSAADVTSRGGAGRAPRWRALPGGGARWKVGRARMRADHGRDSYPGPFSWTVWASVTAEFPSLIVFLPEEMEGSSIKFGRIFILPAFMKLTQFRINRSGCDFCVILHQALC